MYSADKMVIFKNGFLRPKIQGFQKKFRNISKFGKVSPCDTGRI